jgi:hypothetical protein
MMIGRGRRVVRPRHGGMGKEHHCYFLLFGEGERGKELSDAKMARSFISVLSRGECFFLIWCSNSAQASDSWSTAEYSVAMGLRFPLRDVVCGLGSER